MRYSLDNLLPMRFINHFQLLSSAVYILLQEKISQNDISKAESRLISFADQFETLYGEKNLTMNFHMLRHTANSVRFLGPLWVQSNFSFETKNGELVHSRQATKGYLQQLAWKYCMKIGLTSEKKINNVDSNVTCSTKSIKIQLDDNDMHAFRNCGFNLRSNAFYVHNNITIHGKKITSKKYKVVSTVDYFVHFNNEIGAVNFFFSF